MRQLQSLGLMLLLTAMSSTISFAQNGNMAANNASQNSSEETSMKTYVIEREIPHAGQLTQEELKGISKTSCSVLDEMGPRIEWLHSYVTEDKIYCVYKAESKEAIKEHAEKGGFPANSISEMATTISPKTAN